MRLPKSISLRVGFKLADKSKGEIMTEGLWGFAGLDVKAVQVAYDVVCVIFASPEQFRAAISFSGNYLFGLRCSIFGGGPPITRLHVFDFPFEEDDRSLEVTFEAYGAVKSVKKQTFLSNKNIFNGTRLVCGIMVNPWFANFVLFKATDRQTALTRTSAESVGKPGTLLVIVPLTGQRKTPLIFRPWPHLRSLRRPVSLSILLTLSFLRITSLIYCKVSRFCRT